MCIRDRCKDILVDCRWTEHQRSSLGRVVSVLGYVWNSVECPCSGILSHGLHVHAAIDLYVPLDIIHKIWEREGKGSRLHVKQIPREGALYVGKYLAKQRIECLGRRRLWGAFGSCESSKCKDILVDCRWTATY